MDILSAFADVEMLILKVEETNVKIKDIFFRSASIEINPYFYFCFPNYIGYLSMPRREIKVSILPTETIKIIIWSCKQIENDKFHNFKMSVENPHVSIWD